MEYYYAIKRNKLVTQATTWMNSQRIVLNEKSQLQKAIHHTIAFIHSQSDRSTEMENRLAVARGLEGGAGDRGKWMWMLRVIRRILVVVMKLVCSLTVSL